MAKGKKPRPKTRVEILPHILHLLDGLSVYDASAILDEALRHLPRTSIVTIERSELMPELQRQATELQKGGK
jgi:hypothetical protein